MASQGNHSPRTAQTAHAAHWQLIEQLYQDYVVEVWQFAYHRLRGDRDGADDVTATVFLAVTEEIGRFDSARASAGAWIFSIARHKLADYLRRKYRERRRQLVLVEAARGEELFLHDPTLAEDQAAVSRILSGMPAPERDALIWKYCQSLSTRDIAVRLGRTEKACENLLARARERFRAAVGRQDIGDERVEARTKVRHVG